MLTGAPDATHARADSRRACCRIRWRRGFADLLPTLRCRSAPDRVLGPPAGTSAGYASGVAVETQVPDRVRELRAAGYSPKQIAKTLDLRPAVACAGRSTTPAAWVSNQPPTSGTPHSRASRPGTTR